MKNKFFAFLALPLFCAFNSQLNTVHAQGTAFTVQTPVGSGSEY
jgi:hypothetical protein